MKKLQLLLGCILFSALFCGSAMAATPSTFTSASSPIGIVATKGRLLYTTYTTGWNQPSLFEVDSNGNKKVFAPSFPTRGGSVERYMDISPGLAGFPKDYVYVIQGSDIYEITPDGSQVTLFAQLPVYVYDHSGITFDRVGTFENRIIATVTSGQIYTIDSSGTVKYLAKVNTHHENPEVVPEGFGPYGGYVWTAAEYQNRVYAISPEGKVYVVASGIASAETIHVIPEDLCEFGDSGGAFFVSSFNQNRIIKFPASDFTGIKGNVLVTGEYSNPIKMISATDTGYTVTTFDSTRRHHEGATFARCPLIIDITIDIKPGSDINPINIDSNGVIPVAILTTDEFDAAEVDPGTVLFGPHEASPVHYALEDVDNDGDIDMILQFRTQDAGIALSDTEAGLTGKTYKGQFLEGADNVRPLENKGKKK